MAKLIQKNLLCLPTTTVHSKVEELTTSPSTSFHTTKSKNYCIFLFKFENHVEKTSEIIGPGHTKQNTLNMGHITPQKNNSKNQSLAKQSLDIKQEKKTLSYSWLYAALRTRQESHHRSTPVKTWQDSAKQERLVCAHIPSRHSAIRIFIELIDRTKKAILAVDI